MSSNKKAKENLIRIFGRECFIDKLNLRQEPKRYYSNKRVKARMKKLTYHHIIEKSKGRESDNTKWCFIISRKSCMVA